MAATATVKPAGKDRARAAATRSPWVPCLVAWLVPGAGHLLLGRVLQGTVLTLVVLSCFTVGVALDGTVYAFDAEQPLSYLATLANLGAGPLDLWARLETYGNLRYRIPDTRVDPLTRDQVLRGLRDRYVSQTHTYGRTFLLTAGLMNLLLILDVYDYCIGRKLLAGAPASAEPEAEPPPAGGAEG
jgi:hypothetical protein